MNRDVTKQELRQRLDYCANQLAEMEGYIVQEDYAHAAIALQKAVDEYRGCLIDLRMLGTRTGMP